MKVIYCVENGGLGKALKRAVENCSCGIIARMDSDDICVRNRFEQQLSMMVAHTELDIVGGDIREFVDGTSDVAGIRRVPRKDGEIKQYLKKRCPMNHMTVMYKKDSVLQSGGYRDWFCNEDYYLWIRMAEHGCVFANTGTVLVNVRVNMDLYGRRGGMRYFKSEERIQRYMLRKRMIGFSRYLFNVTERFVIQVACTPQMRSRIYRHFARNKK